MRKHNFVCAFFLAPDLSGPGQESSPTEITNCDSIGYPEWRDDCYQSLGKNFKTYSLCLKISNPQKNKPNALRPIRRTSDDECLKQKSGDVDGVLSS